jgi:hypothetical protein
MIVATVTPIDKDPLTLTLTIIYAFSAIVSVIIAISAFIIARRGDAAKSIANATAAGLAVAELQADVARIDKSGSAELGKALERISVLESQVAVYWKGVGQPARVQHNEDDNAELQQALLGINQALQAIQGFMKAEYGNRGRC